MIINPQGREEALTALKMVRCSPAVRAQALDTGPGRRRHAATEVGLAGHHQRADRCGIAQVQARRYAGWPRICSMSAAALIRQRASNARDPGTVLSLMNEPRSIAVEARLAF